MGVWPLIVGVILGIVALFIYPLWSSMSFPPFLGFLKTVPAFFGLVTAILFAAGYAWNEILNRQGIPQGKSGPIPPPSVAFIPLSWPTVCFAQPTAMYHGTPYLEWGRDIISNNRWKLGQTGGVFMSPNFQVAVNHAKKGGGVGAVLKVSIAPDVVLEKMSEMKYCARIPEGVPGKYYRLTGISSNRMLDPFDKRREIS